MMIVTDETVKQRWYDKLTDEYELQAIVLAHYLAEGDNRVDYDEAQDNFDNHDYLVLTDDEADEAVREEIEEMLWAFNSSFLAGETGVDEDVFLALFNNGKCESNNDAIASLIKSTCGLQEFVDSAISADGRGHFLDVNLEENEITFNGITYYIYRRN